MATRFTPEIGDEILALIHLKGWKVCYEWRHPGEPDKFEPIDKVYEQQANTLEVGPRYHVFPSLLPFEEYSMAIAQEIIQRPEVTIEEEKRIVFGFGIREDHCFFVTNTTPHSPTADRAPKDLSFMLQALRSLEPFVDRPEYRIGNQVGRPGTPGAKN